jgi:hypothetical protein
VVHILLLACCCLLLAARSGSGSGSGSGGCGWRTEARQRANRSGPVVVGRMGCPSTRVVLEGWVCPPETGRQAVVLRYQPRSSPRCVCTALVHHYFTAARRGHGACGVGQKAEEGVAAVFQETGRGAKGAGAAGEWMWYSSTEHGSAVGLCFAIRVWAGSSDITVPALPISAPGVGCPAPPLFGRLQGCFEFFLAFEGPFWGFCYEIISWRA